ncbi:MAG TPA: carbohydrate ABC transporter permease [Flexilinea sp.]|jgi:multiple sugar transport system permease protein|nr:carbohydrate ABC transporter permease [Flexilinea sp.]OQA26062.1 MAG: Trehalose transport system permease protein SugB [Chloroflexi bacterium ADurb.Bin344]HOG21204.1 carbohydrate ABC transporter permease [Flexilinea sp.]HOG60739.1 carbohydrate ABC transporter permease [Flexilinea sp.]HOP01999.1 carbohydrate ABC transporter permease [Flexilinea sp.]
MKKKTFGALFRHGFLLAVVIYTLIPIFFTLGTSLKLFRDIISGSLLFKPTLINYERLLNPSQSNFLRLTTNSLLIAAGTMAVVLVIASLAAYSLSRFNWHPLWNGLIQGIILFIHMMPPVTFLSPLYLISRALNIYDTPVAVIMGHIILTLPTAIWILLDFFAEIPKEIEEASIVDGASHFQSLTQVMLPIIQPGLASAGALTFIFSWRDFLFALSLTTTPRGMTIPVGISSFVQEYSIRYGEMAAGSFFAMIPALLMVAFAQRYIIKGMTMGALKE